MTPDLICPACTSGDHEHAELCEQDYRCACACHHPVVDPKFLPCSSCPWRVTQTVDAIPRYSHDKACNLMNTVGHGDAMRPIMACHGSTDDNMRACNGYLAREGWSNINVRLLLARGKIANPDAVLRACESAGVELHLDYPSVLRKLSGVQNIDSAAGSVG